MTVIETFFSVGVAEMERATAFYVAALGAKVMFASPRWSSLNVAGVRIGLFLNPLHLPGRVGLHFVVSDLGTARAAVAHAGGRIIAEPMEVAPGVVTVDVADTEGNVFSMRQG
ncbi:MAG: VOC family protein [Deltaproteobacteria bacterium]|nr:VOC family protein [Deltaproteobacteria bacterium]